MTVYDFIDMLNSLTDEQKQYQIEIYFSTPSAESYDDDQYALTSFKIENVLDYMKCVIIKGK